MPLHAASAPWGRGKPGAVGEIHGETRSQREPEPARAWKPLGTRSASGSVLERQQGARKSQPPEFHHSSLDSPPNRPIVTSRLTESVYNTTPLPRPQPCNQTITSQPNLPLGQINPKHRDSICLHLLDGRAMESSSRLGM